MTIISSFRLLAIAAAIALATGSVSVQARQTTGFASFRVFNPSQGTNPYSCLVERSGAVMNNCPFDVTLVFGLMSDNVGVHSITVQSYWGSSASFSCTPYAYAGTGQGMQGNAGTFYQTFYNITSTSTINPSVNVAAAGDSIQLICWGVPPGAGIYTINWSP